MHLAVQVRIRIAATNVVVHSLFQSLTAAVMKVRRRDRNIAQRRCLERSHIFRTLGLFEPADIAHFFVRHTYTDVVKLIVGE